MLLCPFFSCVDQPLAIRRVDSEKSTIPRLTLGLSLIMWKLGFALIDRSLNFIFGYGYSNSEVMKKSTSNLPYNMKPSGQLSIFILPLKKSFRQRRFHNLIMKFIIVVTLAVQNSVVFRCGPPTKYGIVKLMRIQTIRVVKLLVLKYTSKLKKKLSKKCCLHK